MDEYAQTDPDEYGTVDVKPDPDAADVKPEPEAYDPAKHGPSEAELAEVRAQIERQYEPSDDEDAVKYDGDAGYVIDDDAPPQKWRTYDAGAE